MLEKTLLTVKVNKKIKNQASKLAEEMGLNVSTLINIYLRDFIKSKRVTIDLNPQQKYMSESDDPEGDYQQVADLRKTYTPKDVYKSMKKNASTFNRIKSSIKRGKSS